MRVIPIVLCLFLLLECKKTLPGIVESSDNDFNLNPIGGDLQNCTFASRIPGGFNIVSTDTVGGRQDTLFFMQIMDPMQGDSAFVITNDSAKVAYGDKWGTVFVNGTYVQVMESGRYYYNDTATYNHLSFAPGYDTIQIWNNGGANYLTWDNKGDTMLMFNYKGLLAGGSSLWGVLYTTLQN